LSRNTADLALGVFWRQFLGNFVSAVLMALCDITIVIIVLWAMFIVEPVVSMMVAGVLGISAFIIFSRVRRLLDLTLKKLRDYRQEINRDVTKAMHGIKEVKVYGREDLFVEDYRKKAYAEARLDALQFFLGQSPQWILEALGFFMLSAAIYLMMFYMDFSEAKVTGMMALCAVAAWRILPSINKILGRLVNARSALPFVQKSLDYFHEIETARKAGVPMQKTALSYSFKNSIRFSNVLFKYDTAEADALNDINILIPKGKTVGIIGMSGAGKSTLVDLLIGLLHPTSGRVMIDEMELKHELTTSWLRIIGYVGQNPYICDGTLSENVAFGMKSDAIDSGRVLECCSMAAMGDFISDLPNGIDTQIGERGVMLSGGQRQRVAIARALYNKPDVLIFDEATSSLDTKSEKAIQNTIYSFKGKQTLIIIAHRLSTVEDCDEIIWLEKGSVRQIGTPKEILPIYKRYMQDEKPDIKQTEK
jgi:ABC-type multidrug transport system fused ATPase/permease subunit